jgi:hypothetical protein
MGSDFGLIQTREGVLTEDMLAMQAVSRASRGTPALGK